MNQRQQFRLQTDQGDVGLVLFKEGIGKIWDGKNQQVLGAVISELYFRLRDIDSSFRIDIVGKTLTVHSRSK